MEKIEENRAYFLKISKAKMPFGRYCDRLLIELPETYLIWLKNKGFPKGELGNMLNVVYEVKLNGLEHLFKKNLAERN